MSNRILTLALTTAILLPGASRVPGRQGPPLRGARPKTQAAPTPPAPKAQPAPADSSAARASAARNPRIVLERRDGTVEVRELAGFSTNDPRELGAAMLRFEGLAPVDPGPRQEDSGVIELASGDRLNGRMRGGRAELLDIELAGGVHVGVAIDELASVVFPARIPDTWTGTLTAPEEGDLLYRRTQEGLDPDKGGVEEFTTDGVRFHGQVGARLVPWSEIAALFVESLEPEAPRQADGQKASVVVDFVDQSRLRGRLEKIDAQGVKITTHNGESLLVPAAVVANVLVDDGSLAYLSSFAPAEAQDSTPFGDELGMVWPHRIDRAVDGSPLSAGGRVFTRGLGVHAPSRLSWKLDGSWKSLRGSVAIDDQALRLSVRGSVVFRVLVDGEKKWESPLVRGGDPPLAIDPPLALEGAHEVALEVGTGPDGHAGDRADWLGIVLVR